MEEGFIKLIVNDRVLDSFYEVRVDEKEEVYLPLRGIFSQLKLHLFRIDLDEGLVEGQLPYSEKKYAFDLKTGRMLVNGEPTPVDDNAYFRKEDELYLHYRSLEKWLPLEVDWSLQETKLVIEPDFPLIWQILEEKRELGAETRDNLEEEDPKIPAPKVFSPGSFFLSFGPRLSYLSSKRELNLARPRLKAGYVGPLFFGNVYSRLEFTEELEVKLDKFNLRYRNLQRLAGAELTLGETQLEFPDLVRESSRMWGILLKGPHPTPPRSNLEAAGPPGSLVELYERGRLVDYGKISESGDVVFEQVPFSGNKARFKVKTYTPRGRLFTRKERVLLHPSHLSDDDISYFAGLGRTSEGSLGVSARFTRGFTDNFTVGPQLMATHDVRKGQTEGFLGGVLTFRPRGDTYIHLDSAAKLGSSGRTAKVELGNLIHDWGWKAGLIGYRGMRPPVRDEVFKLGERRYLNWKTYLKASWKGRRDLLSLTYDLADFSGERRFNFKAEYRKDLGFRERFDLDACLSFWQGDDWSTTFEASYKFSPAGGIESRFGLEVSFDEGAFPGYGCFLDLQLDRALPESTGLNVVSGFDDRGELDLQARLRFDPRDSLGFSATLDEQPSFKLGLTFDFNIITDSLLRFRLDTRSPTRGYIEGYVYLELVEEDGKQAREPLGNVGILLEGERVAETDEEGFYRVDDVPSGLKRKLELETSDLDALHLPKEESFSVKLTRGRGLKQDFAVIPITGISGFVRGSFDDFPCERITVILKDESGELVDKTSPGFEGFYSFDQIPAGKYILTLQTAEGVGFVPQKREVKITPGKIPDWYEGLDFNLDPN